MFVGSVADETVPVDEKMENIIDDAFKVLIDNEKKISEAITKSKKSSTDEIEDIEEMNEGAANREPKKSHGHPVVITEVRKVNKIVSYWSL